MAVAQRALLLKTAADELVDWINGRAFDTAGHFAVGLAGTCLILGRRGGSSRDDDDIDEIERFVRRQEWYPTVADEVYLATMYSEPAEHQHAEMCVLASADTMGLSVRHLAVTGSCCAACRATAAANGISVSADVDGDEQAGWLHPQGGLGLGIELNPDWPGQLAELAAYNAWLAAGAPGTFPHRLTRALRDPIGEYAWLC